MVFESSFTSSSSQEQPSPSKSISSLMNALHFSKKERKKKKKNPAYSHCSLSKKWLSHNLLIESSSSLRTLPKQTKKQPLPFHYKEYPSILTNLLLPEKLPLLPLTLLIAHTLYLASRSL